MDFKKENNTNSSEVNQQVVDNVEEIALDDERRIKVLSPSQLVAKRFFRNKLAIVGLVIIAFMFLFSFLGGVLMPYSETEVFRGYELVSKEYAYATVNKDFRYISRDNKEISSALKARLGSAIAKGEYVFVAGEETYYADQITEQSYNVYSLLKVGEAVSLRGLVSITPNGEFTISDQDKTLISEAIKNNLDKAENYIILKEGKFYNIYTSEEICISTKNIYTPYNNQNKVEYGFVFAFENAVADNMQNFLYDGKSYTIAKESNHYIISENNTPYMLISSITVRAAANDIVLGTDFILNVSDAVENNKKEFIIGEDEYEISGVNGNYKINKETETQLIKIYEAPSQEHWLGTDMNGMDILTRLMYGGRVSLMIGFVVVIIEVLLGVVLGGISGYFGGFIDNLIMRIVDIFNCIPSLPLFIIIGSIMEGMKLDPQLRIINMMVILGLLSWPAIARLVRGQILSLREQEFMTATEAIGVSVPRRIFKHLIPNVIPQLIVMATMGLGSVILTESTLSFLGLGVKFPFASWGNIINAVSSVFVMTNYPFVWIPAGILILLTVLGFNFVGDGLRDAFDPKMKR